MKRWAIVLVTILLTLEFLLSGGMMLGGAAQMVAIFERFGLPIWFMYFTGVVEVSGALGLILYKHWLGFVAAAALTVTMIVATGIHLFFDPPSESIAAIILALLLGLITYHRRSLWALSPFTKQRLADT